jgi:iron complex outermembrane recepter protein
MTLAFSPTNGTTKYGTTSTDNYLRFSFRTGPLQHVLASGVNTTSLNYVQNEYYPPDYPFLAVQAYAPQQYDFPHVTRNADSLGYVIFVKDSQYGLYAQDLITFRNLHAVLNIRRSHYQDGPGANVVPGYGTFDFPKQSFSHTTPGAGLVYNITPDVSVYGEYSEGFQENYASILCGRGNANIVPPPQTSENEELGVKTSLPNGLFSLTSDIFSVTENNVLQENFAQRCYTLTPGYRTRGVEVDAQGQLAKGWNLIANFSDARYSDVGDYTQLITGEPRLHFRLWSTYAFQNRYLRGFGVAGGVTAYSWSYTNYAPGYANEPGAARIDLSAFYQRRRWSVILGVKNIANRTLYQVTTTPLGVPVEPGRTVTFTAKYRFL